MDESVTDLMDFEISNDLDPSLTFKVSNGRILGTVDGIEAMTQAVWLMVTHERYSSPIFNTYGIEIDRLIAQPKDFIVADLRRTFEDALLIDNRFLSIENFLIEDGKQKGSLLVTFTVTTTEGSINIRGMEVSL